MTTYAKYADMYRQRLARSQDARLEFSNATARDISPVRSHSSVNNRQSATNQKMTIPSMGNQLQQQPLQSAFMMPGGTINTMQSPKSVRASMQRQSLHGGGAAEIPSHLKMGQDRSAYMTFLEVQLERVTQACNNALSFQDKVEAMQTQLNGNDEKVQNIGRLVKLLQSFSEAQEEDVSTLKVSLRNLAIQIDEVGSQQQHRQQQQQQVHQETYDSGAFGALTNTNHAVSVSPTRTKRSLSKSKSPARRSEQKIGSVGDRVQTLERQIKSMISGGFQTNSLGTPDRTRLPNIDQMKEDLNNFAQEVDIQMRDVEARIVTNLSQHVEESSFHTNAKIDEALLLLDQKIQRIENMNSATFQRPNVIQSTQIVEDGKINPAKMEAALNDWLSKVEEQVNQIEDQVNAKAAQTDLKGLERRWLDSIEQKDVRFQQLEQYCQKMCEQGNSRYDKVQEISLDWEDRFLQIQRHVESTLNDQSRSMQEGVGRGSLLQSGITSQYDTAIGGGDLTSIRTLEKKLAKRLGEGVERLGDIIKDMAKAQRKLDSRTSNLELKAFGSTNIKESSKKKVVGTVKDKEVALIQSARGNSKKTDANLQHKKVKSGASLRNSNSVKSPNFKQPVVRRRSQKSFSPPVKDASQGPVDKRANSIKRRSRSKSSIKVRLNQPEVIERPNSVSARHQNKGNLNNFRTSFEQRLLQDGGVGTEELSPREILRRARDRSVREISQSVNDSRSRSPHSQRLQSLVDIETASPHQHHKLSTIQQQESHYGAHPSQNISILNGPASGQKNIVAQNMTQVISGAREFEMDQLRQRGSGLNTGREYMTHPNDPSYLDQRMSTDEMNPQFKQRKSSVKRSIKGRKSSREPRSASRDCSRDGISAYTLQDLEKREKSLKKKISAKKDQGDSGDISRGRVINTSRTKKATIVEKAPTSKERSLSQRTFQKMNAMGHNTVMAGARGANTRAQRQISDQDISYGSLNQNQRKFGRQAKNGADHQVRDISPNKTTGQLKTTKSIAVVNGAYHQKKSSVSRPQQQTQKSGSARGTRVRSRSANCVTEQSPRSRPGVVGFHRTHQTAAQEIFGQTLDQHRNSHTQIHTLNSRRGSSNNNYQNHLGSFDQPQQARKISAKRQRSISIDHSREEKKSLNATADNLGKKQRSSLAAKQGDRGTPASSKKVNIKAADTSLGAASKTAKQKLKNLQNKKSNQRLAKLEKMYQDLTEIEAKTATQI